MVTSANKLAWFERIKEADKNWLVSIVWQVLNRLIAGWSEALLTTYTSIQNFVASVDVKKTFLLRWAKLKSVLLCITGHSPYKACADTFFFSVWEGGGRGVQSIDVLEVTKKGSPVLETSFFILHVWSPIAWHSQSIKGRDKLILE